MSFWNSFGLQDAMSPVMEEFIFFHDFVFLVLTFATTVVGGMMIMVNSFSWIDRSLIEGQLTEMFWTAAPVVFLVVISMPSLLLLYSLDEVSNSMMTLKVVGHQWYWSYEFTDFWSGESPMEFDAYLLPQDFEESLRLLDTDNRPSLPFLTQIRLLVSSSDVLHSWAVPSLGVKLDAVPGRLNQTKFMSYRPGVAYGQCSEICGANHSFMPIALEFTSSEDFMDWLRLGWGWF